MTMDFLPISREDMKQRGWEQCDFVYISGDAYVDHPSFGPAIISRLLEAHGYKVGIIAQPDWKNPESLRKAETGIFSFRGEYGFHGEPLYGVQKAQSTGFLYARRCHGKTAGLCHHCLL